MSEDIDGQDDGYLDRMRENEAILEQAKAADEKGHRTANRMYWLLNTGFIMVVANAATIQSSVALAIGAAIMAVPMVWITMKEGF